MTTAFDRLAEDLPGLPLRAHHDWYVAVLEFLHQVLDRPLTADAQRGR